jgi:LmbE family N-acetylglucosaminyl deacetylase
LRLSFTNARVLAVVAHPDDAELLCAAALARAKQDGAAIGVCVLCQGDKGQTAEAIADLADVRGKEMQASAKKLGAELFTCAFEDGTLADTQPARKKVMEVLRRFRPTLVLAHAPEDYHPDHKAASALADAVTWFCASRGQKSRLPPLEEPPELWWMDCVNRMGFEPGFYIDVSPFVELKERLLQCHASQIQRGGDRDFVPLLELMRLQTAARGAEAGVAAAEAFRIHRSFKRTRAW